MRYAILIIGVMFVTCASQAQLRVAVNLNIGDQPAWGPVGYDYVEYYYLPDIEVYYYVPTRTYYYFEGGRWVGRSRLPARYRNYDFYHSYKVVVNEREPYRHHERYRDMYAMYRGHHDQEVIRDSHDSRYFVVRDHPEHEKWEKEHGQGNGHSHGRGNGRGRGNKH